MNIIKIKTLLESTDPLVATDIGHFDVCSTVEEAVAVARQLRCARVAV